MRTMVFCERCNYLFGCINGDTKLCLFCEDTCILGSEENEKEICGLCVPCLEEMVKFIL
jgi:hypothetical protein